MLSIDVKQNIERATVSLVNGKGRGSVVTGNLILTAAHLDGQLFKPQPVMEALDEAMTVLFRYTEFHDVGFNLFLKFSESKLSYEEEEMLKALGVRF